MEINVLNSTEHLGGTDIILPFRHHLVSVLSERVMRGEILHCINNVQHTVWNSTVA